MSPDTVATPPGDANTTNHCGTGNGLAVTTILELAKAAGRSVGAVTTTRVTHATPAATYAHICHRDLENDIAAQVVPGGAGFNVALGAGVDVLMGGGRKHFLPDTVTGGYRTDGRDLMAELSAKGYAVATDRAGFDALPASGRLIGLFTASHMSYELDRDPAQEPSLAEMTLKALSALSKNPQGYFLMVEGGRIDHALHETNAVRALQETVAFDQAIASALAFARAGDPALANTLVVVTADHDHTIVLNGYAQRTGATTPGNAGVLGLVKNVVSGEPENDAEGVPYTIIGFGNGENRFVGARSDAAPLTDETTSARDYHQEAAVRMAAGAETHGGTDVSAMAIGAGAKHVHGFMTNTEIFGALREAAGL
jgi:alkaline phosphatase